MQLNTQGDKIRVHVTGYNDVDALSLPVVTLLKKMDSASTLLQDALNRDRTSPTMTALCKTKGAVIPFSIDPETGKAYFLLGVSKEHHEVCHLSGLVEEGETVMCGTAREAYEESKGAIGTQQALFLALMDVRYHVVWGHHHTAVFWSSVNLGPMRTIQRQELVRKFGDVPAHHPKMDEVSSLCFVEVSAVLRVWSDSDDALFGIPLWKEVAMGFEATYLATLEVDGDWILDLAAVPARTSVLPLPELSARCLDIPISTIIPSYQWGCLGTQTGTVIKVWNGWGVIRCDVALIKISFIARTLWGMGQAKRGHK